MIYVTSHPALVCLYPVLVIPSFVIHPGYLCAVVEVMMIKVWMMVEVMMIKVSRMMVEMMMIKVWLMMVGWLS